VPGMVAVDDKTIAYAKAAFSADAASCGTGGGRWRTLQSDEGAQSRPRGGAAGRDIAPQVTWGTSPEMVTTVYRRVPDPATIADPIKRQGVERALEYMGLAPNTPMSRSVSTRCSSVRAPTRASRTCAPRPRWRAGRRKADSVKQVLVVPGSGTGQAPGRGGGAGPIFTRPDSNGANRAARCAWP
jgi:3-isopropylmalate/(R)-2-methylmalate dehydratase large subunit